MDLKAKEALLEIGRKKSLVRGSCGSLLPSDGGPEARFAAPAFFSASRRL
jgi:hypothetical protein